MRKLLAALVLLALPCAAAWPNGYRYRRTITVDHTKCGASDSTNFPVLVSGAYSYLATAANGGRVQNSSGYDVIFTSDAAGRSKLNWEVEQYTASSGAVVYWVQIPTVSHSADTAFYLFYGNAAIASDQSNRTATWDSGYALVYHWGTPSSLSLTDSTSHANTGTNDNAVTAASGLIGGAGSFATSSSQYVTFSTVSSGTSGTTSAWIKPNGQSGSFNFGPIIGNSGSSNIDPIQVSGSTDTSFGYSQGSGGVSHTVSSMTGVWHYLVSVRNGLTVTLYLDGTQVASASLQSNESALLQCIGRRNSGGLYYNGLIDETRISTTLRSADWILAEYNNQSSPSTFYSVGAEQLAGTPALLNNPVVM